MNSPEKRTLFLGLFKTHLSLLESNISKLTTLGNYHEAYWFHELMVKGGCSEGQFQFHPFLNVPCRDRVTVPVGLVLLDERVAGDEVAGYGRGFHPSTASS